MCELEALELANAGDARLVFVLGHLLAYEAKLPRSQVNLYLVNHGTIVLQILVKSMATLVDFII